MTVTWRTSTKYAISLLRHVWYVRKMCWANGLYWQGLVHDWSKWRPKEFLPYARYFYGPKLKVGGRVFVRCLDGLPPGWATVIEWRDVKHAHWKVRQEFGDPTQVQEYWAHDDEVAYDDGKKAFDLAWLHHQKLNPHHWQYWLLPRDDGSMQPLEIPEKYVKEMICDWWGASMAYGNKGRNRDWYEANKDNMALHPETREYVERAIRNSETPYLLPPLKP